MTDFLDLQFLDAIKIPILNSGWNRAEWVMVQRIQQLGYEVRGSSRKGACDVTVTTFKPDYNEKDCTHILHFTIPYCKVLKLKL